MRAIILHQLLEVIQYLVNKEGKDTLVAKNKRYGRYPLHWACLGAASLDVIQYLVNEGGKDKLMAKDSGWMYPLHWACYKGALLDVIQYLVNEGGKCVYFGAAKVIRAR